MSSFTDCKATWLHEDSLFDSRHRNKSAVREIMARAVLQSKRHNGLPSAVMKKVKDSWSCSKTNRQCLTRVLSQPPQSRIWASGMQLSVQRAPGVSASGMQADTP